MDFPETFFKSFFFFQNINSILFLFYKKNFPTQSKICAKTNSDLLWNFNNKQAYLHLKIAFVRNEIKHSIICPHGAIPFLNGILIKRRNKNIFPDIFSMPSYVGFLKCQREKNNFKIRVCQL